MATDHFDNMELLPEAPHSRVSSPPHFTGPTCRVGTVDPSLHSSSSPASPSAPQLNSSSDSTTGQESPGGWSRGRARNTVTGPCCPPEREGRRTRQAEERKREAGGGACLLGHTLFRFAVQLVSPQCFQESRRSSLFAPFPASLCALEAQRRRRLRLCCAGLRTDRAGTAFHSALLAPQVFRQPPYPVPDIQLSFSGFLESMIEAIALNLGKGKFQKHRMTCPRS